MHEFRPGDIIYWREDYHVEERVIDKEEWEKVRDSADNLEWKPDKVYTVKVVDNYYQGYCAPSNFTLVRSARDIIFKEAL